MAKRQQRRRSERRRRHAERRTRRRLITGAGVTVGAVLGIGSPALAHDFTVNRGGDAGDNTCDSSCTLRDAIGDSNENFEADNIYFESNLSGSTITLTGGDLPITTYGLYIHGPGAGQLTISGNDADRIFYVNPFSSDYHVNINGLTLTDGAATDGGAIYHKTGELRVIDAVLTGNFA